MTAAIPPAPTPTPVEESRRRIHDALLAARKVAVGTHAGEEVRVRMMHPGAWIPDDVTACPLIYLASMKTDPKIREMTTRPEVALLLHESPQGEENTSWEMEVTGRAEVVRDPAERERAKQATMRTSSIRFVISATSARARKAASSAFDVATVSIRRRIMGANPPEPFAGFSRPTNWRSCLRWTATRNCRRGRSQS